MSWRSQVLRSILIWGLCAGRSLGLKSSSPRLALAHHSVQQKSYLWGESSQAKVVPPPSPSSSCSTGSQCLFFPHRISLPGMTRLFMCSTFYQNACPVQTRTLQVDCCISSRQYIAGTQSVFPQSVHWISKDIRVRQNESTGKAHYWPTSILTCGFPSKDNCPIPSK